MSIPLDLNPVLWLKADAGISASPVATWADQSGNENDATQPTAGNQPTLVLDVLNSLPVVRFAYGGYELQSFLLLTTPITTARTVFIVFRHTGTTNYQQCWYFGHSTATDWHPANDSILFDPSYSSARVRNGSGWVDGVATAPTSMTKPAEFQYLSFLTTDSVKIGQFGKDRAGATSSFVGDIAEILVFDTPLSDADRQSVEAYLNGKWFLSTPIKVHFSANVSGIVQVRFTQ